MWTKAEWFYEMTIMYFFKIFYLEYIQDGKDCTVELSLTITSNVMKRQCTLSTLKVLSKLLALHRKILKSVFRKFNLASILLLSFFFLFFIERDNDLIFNYSNIFCNSFLLFYKHQKISTLYHHKIIFLPCNKFLHKNANK